MIEWRDEGLLLAARPFGESAAIVEVLTPSRGRHAGVVRGGASRRIAPILQPGAQLDVTWKARLEDHLGAFTVEPLRSRAAAAMADRLSLAGLGAVCALLSVTLAEREAHAALYTRTVQLLDLLGQRDLWPLAYLRWEQALLAELGYGLDLGTCAVTGASEGLIYISPRSGRAVSAAGAGEWADRMLPLPPVLAGQGEAENADIVAGLEVTGYFIENRLIRGQDGTALPAARSRLLAAIAREGGR
ncbi:DNA repair protein RecO [Salipiger sp. IMCC34102]|uniref:DNA repair protein RecO n=1 Tax=Salipiger sp. IMCC34102 TaxID=2510647 RepID=UPI00101C11F7|nr:DNA repair protein RecO [Salipiger sp. IMCC34102]RYH04320.1 DNA repair protein RecO [Salipiger sp. IMCC34102]